VYVGEDPGWAVPHDAVENPYGDEGWAVSPESGRAAFVGEASTEVAGAEPGWPAGLDAQPSTPKPAGRKIGLALLVVSLLGAGAIVTAGFIDSPGSSGQSPIAGVPGANPPQGRGGSAVLTAPLDGLANATFDLADSANSVRLHAADLGGDLYRVSAPAGSGLLPRVVRSGAEVRLYLSHAAQPGTGVVDVAVNSTVGWRLQLDAGVAQTVLDMGAGKVDGIDLAGGASRIELILPKPQGQVAVRMTGGVDQFLVRLAKLTPVRVRADSGAGQVTVGGSTHHGIAAGQSFTANGWGEDAPGVDVQAVAGMSALTVTES